jgi:hypothetical protein
MRQRKWSTGADLFAVRCSACGRVCVYAPGGYVACPSGHGKRRLDDDRPDETELAGLWAGPEELDAE